MNKEIYGYVYMIRNKVNGKLYFGITVNDFQTRYYGNILKYTHNEHLKHSIQKYGIENFEINEQFDIAYSEDDLWDLEDMYICLYDTIKNGYNERRSGSKHKGRGHFNHKEETKNKITDAVRKDVVCLNTGEVFHGILLAYHWATGKYDDKHVSKICQVCKGQERCAYKHPETGEKLVWRYKEDYDKMTKEEIETLLNEVNPTREITDSFNELNENVSYTQNMFKTTLEDKLSPIYSILSPAQTYVFNEYFLNGNTMQEIAERHNVTTTRIGNLTKQVIAKITNTYSVNEFYKLLEIK